ncbi:MAG: T9SS type A sorting domain-containing protein [Bacteroidetes bacterium]|nr:T9SS type A sorting domain-containing protein [Bacteroidota bacterium]
MYKILATAFILLSSFAFSQIPNPALVGYWQNWNDANAPYSQLDLVDSRYNIIEVSFAVPQAGTDYKMEFIPDQVSQSTLITQIQALQSQGKKVLISMGGATAPISLSNSSERDTFVSTMNNIINTYGFDGIDIDFEGSSLSTTGGTISAPVDAPIINLIDAVKQIMSDYYVSHNKKLLLTMAPETAFVHGGQSAYGGIWGAYLPVIDALRDSLDILQVQLYNSGSMYGIDGNIYSQGTTDFIIAMTESIIQGFNTGGGSFIGLPANKIAIGLPACPSAAGGGYTNVDSVKTAMDYLRGTGTKPGTYTLLQSGGYPTLLGMMTWSINWDAVSTCGSTYEYADNFDVIFNTPTNTQNIDTKKSFTIYPNPANDKIYISSTINGNDNRLLKIYNSIGENVLSRMLTSNSEIINIEELTSGIYMICFDRKSKVFIKN